MPNSRIGTAFVVLSVLSTGVLVGCGGNKTDAAAAKSQGPSATTTADDAVPPNILTDRVIDAQPAGGPGRALLQWAQAIQFSDNDSVAGLSTPDAIARIGGRAQLDKAVGFMGASFALVTVVNVLQPSPTTARVRATLSSFDAKGQRVQFTPTTFDLSKVGAAWKLSDLKLVAATLRDYEALARKKG
ncbi:MAG: hypothetical protein AAGC46_10240 [Solirubrobacteraceae bacterium]|nr:hypothetical protein [Patulibacter sp.]